MGLLLVGSVGGLPILRMHMTVTDFQELAKRWSLSMALIIFLRNVNRLLARNLRVMLLILSLPGAFLLLRGSMAVQTSAGVLLKYWILKSFIRSFSIVPQDLLVMDSVCTDFPDRLPWLWLLGQRKEFAW